MASATIIQEIRIFSATWNVGGKTPSHGLNNLKDFLQVECSSDIYVLGFQEIVPLSAGNVLVIEDNKPALKWQELISHALNKSYHDSLQSSSSYSGSSDSKSSKNSKAKIFRKTSLKVLTENLRADSNHLKACNCSNRRKNISLPEKLNYQIIASKQMVGIFLTIWARVELVKDIGHLRISCMGRGIMGCLGNKGCISISLTLHQTSFCFMCCHLASGEKKEDQLRRNSDVAEILKNTRFSSRVCKNKKRRIPERILDHKLIWLGDLNYRVALSYEETRLLLEEHDRKSLLEKDQLNMVREAGNVFKGWIEGKILFAPTYKYSHNSDSYVGETANSKKKRRTPSWCDRILWRGNGIKQLAYIRKESKFSDHRPVCAVFAVEVETKNKSHSKFIKGFLLHKHKNRIYMKTAYVPQTCLVCSI